MGIAQKWEFYIGNNINRYSDWKFNKFMYFNPEIGAHFKQNQKHSILFSIDGAYGKAHISHSNIGYDRLYFNARAGYERVAARVTTGLGTALRLRHDNIFLPFPNDVVMSGSLYLDPGIYVQLIYEIPIVKNATNPFSLLVRQSYYGKSPQSSSLGIFKKL